MRAAYGSDVVVTDHLAPSAAPRIGTWMGPLFAVLAALMVPWSIYLAISLPNKAVARHYAISWAGFDVWLAVVLAWTAYSAIRRTRWLPIAASINAAMLLVDAWFDVLTAPRHSDLLWAVATAVLLELPLAAVCLWIAINARRITDGTVTLDVTSWRQDDVSPPDSGH